MNGLKYRQDAKHFWSVLLRRKANLDNLLYRDSLPPDFEFKTHCTSPTIEGRNTSPYGIDSRNRRESTEEKVAICSDSASSYSEFLRKKPVDETE